MQCQLLLRDPAGQEKEPAVGFEGAFKERKQNAGGFAGAGGRRTEHGASGAASGLDFGDEAALRLPGYPMGEGKYPGEAFALFSLGGLFSDVFDDAIQPFEQKGFRSVAVEGGVEPAGASGSGLPIDYGATANVFSAFLQKESVKTGLIGMGGIQVPFRRGDGLGQEGFEFLDDPTVAVWGGVDAVGPSFDMDLETAVVQVEGKGEFREGFGVWACSAFVRVNGRSDAAAEGGGKWSVSAGLKWLAKEVLDAEGERAGGFVISDHEPQWGWSCSGILVWGAETAGEVVGGKLGSEGGDEEDCEDCDGEGDKGGVHVGPEDRSRLKEGFALRADDDAEGSGSEPALGEAKERRGFFLHEEHPKDVGQGAHEHRRQGPCACCGTAPQGGGIYGEENGGAEAEEDRRASSDDFRSGFSQDPFHFHAEEKGEKNGRYHADTGKVEGSEAGWKSESFFQQVAAERGSDDVELAAECAHGGGEEGNKEEDAKEGRQGCRDVHGNDSFDIAPCSLQCEGVGGLVEEDIGQRSHEVGDTDGQEDKESADGNGAVEFGLAADRHEAHDELGLGQNADGNPCHDGADESPPEDGAESGESSPTLVAESGEAGGDCGVEGGEFFVGGGQTAQPVVGKEEERDHTGGHHGRLEGVSVQHAFEPAQHDADGDDTGKEVECLLVGEAEMFGEKLGCAHQNGGGIEGHEQKDQSSRRGLDGTGAVTAAEQFGKSVGIEAEPESASRRAEEGEGDENADEDVGEGEPHEAHSVHGGHATEADDSGGGDKGGAVGERHDPGVASAAGEKVVGDGAGITKAAPAEKEDDAEIGEHEGGKGDFFHGDRGV